jgi:molybdenum cofactor biosynthesis enzyme MoaA
MKPNFTDRELNELIDQTKGFGYEVAVLEILKFLKDLGYSDTNAVITEIRKEFLNKRIREHHNKRRERFKDSTLQDKLIARIDWNDLNVMIDV